MIKKTDLVKQAVMAGDYKKALRIAKDFNLNITSDQKNKMALAYECMVHPDFYKQLGKDIGQSIKDGKDVVIALYGA